MTSDTSHRSSFVRFAEAASRWAGKAGTFIAASVLIIGWAVTGPIFDFSDTWQLVIGTMTTILTFLMVFLIQNTQNRDSKAIHLKLDELIRTTKGAHTVLLDIEKLSDEELEQIGQKYDAIAEEGRKRMRKGESDTQIPSIVLDQ